VARQSSGEVEVKLSERPPRELSELLQDHGLTVRDDGRTVLIRGSKDDLLEALLNVPPKLSMSSRKVIKELWRALGADRPRLR